jgi:hypothetical protein
MAYKPIGPGYLVLTTGTTSTSSNWTAIKAQSATYDSGLQLSWQTDAFTTARLASGLINMPAEPRLQCEIIDADLTTLVEFMLESSVTLSPTDGDVLGLPDSVSFIAAASVPVIGFIPLAQAASGSAAANGIWFPKGYIENWNDLRYQRIDAGGDATNPYTVSVMGLLDDVTIATGYRTGFIGSAATTGETYTLPTLSTTAV